MAFVNQPGAGVAYSMVAQSEGMVPQPGYYPQPGMMPQPGYYPQPGMIPMQQVPGVPLPPGAAVQWMQRPSPMPGVPVGLEYLTQMQGLMVQQQTSLTEVITGFDTNNKYKIMNMSGMQCYFAMEDSDTCQRMMCGAKRAFQFKIVDNLGAEVIHISRPFKCCGGCGICAFCSDCAAHEVTIESPPGTVIGYVKQAGSWWKPKFNILDENHECVLRIEGPCCIFDGPFCCGDSQFKVLTLDGASEVGRVTKKYAGFARELGSTADNFGIEFPLDLSVKVKASLLGALLLIDFMYFEAPPQNNNNRY